MPTSLFAKPFLCVFLSSLAWTAFAEDKGLPLYYWNERWHGRTFVNFGDYLSLKLVEKIVGSPLRIWKRTASWKERKMLAIGSIMYFARENDVVWGTGVSGRKQDKSDFKFTHLDVRAVRGPLTRAFLMDNFQIPCPEIYGDPALLMPYLFTEFKRQKHPKYDYIIIPHYSEEELFLKEEWDNVVYPTEPWDEVVRKILDSRFVISSSLHGIVVAEAYGIPARMLHVSDNEPIFKYQDYYLGTNRPNFKYATTVEEAFELGGEEPFECDLEKLYNAFPFEYWPNAPFKPLGYK
jgi:pyruvyltransferase